jgi:hypothetical protein
LTYAQKFNPWNLKFSSPSQAAPLKSTYRKLLFLNEYMNLLSSRAIQGKPYFSRLCGPSCRVFNKVIHSFLGLLLKPLKNNNLQLVSRIFMSKKMTKCMRLLMLSGAHKVLNAKVA